MRLWQKLLISYLFIISATATISVLGIRSTGEVRDSFYEVTDEVIPHMIALKDLRYSGLRVVSSTMEYAFLTSMESMAQRNGGGGEYEDEKRTEIELIEEGRAEFRKSLDACRTMLAEKEHPELIEQAGGKLLAASEAYIRLLDRKPSPEKLFEQKEVFEECEMEFLQAVKVAHDHEMREFGTQVADSFSSVTSAVKSATVLSVVGIAVSLALSISISRSISRRIGLLWKAAGAVAAGKRDVVVPVTSNDEITLLSISFNQMVERLWDSEEEVDATTRYLDSIIVTMPEALTVVSLDGFILDINQATEVILGFPKCNLVGREFAEFFRDPDAGREFVSQVVGGPASVEHEATLMTRDGREKHVILSATMLEAKGKKDRFLCLSHDITLRKQAELAVHNLAYFDQLTGLANRTLFYDRCSQALSHAQRHNDMFAILFIDLDHFKDVNDTMGHDAGDELLQMVVRRFESCVRACDTLARLGGDEFALLCSSIAGPEGAATVAEKFLSLIKQPFEIANRQVYTGASIGIVLYPEDGGDIGVLLRNADLAMYAAKSAGGNLYQFYSRELNRKAQERSDIEEALRRALQGDELSLYYQPQLDLASGSVTGMEALARWDSAELGPVSPDRFIPIAEQTGLIKELGEWVLKTACARCKDWHRSGHEVRVSVNVSMKQLVEDDFAEMVVRTLLEAGLEPQFLVLELTESVLMEDAPQSVALLKMLKSLGVKISIDDFGTGYSSLSYLKNFSIDHIKVDQSFVRDITSRGDALGIVKAIVAIGHSMGLRVIAEGVESAQEAEKLLQCKCDEVQGYHFGKPMCAEEALQFLAKQAHESSAQC